MVPVLSRSREFSLFLDGTGTGTGKNWSRKKVPVPVSEKIGPGKKYRYRYRKNLVPEKSTGPGTGKNSGYRHTLSSSDHHYALLMPFCIDTSWYDGMQKTLIILMLLIILAQTLQTGVSAFFPASIAAASTQLLSDFRWNTLHSSPLPCKRW